VAVKMFESMQLSQVQDQTMHELRKEAQMMEKLSNHPHIVKFVGAITKGTKLYARWSDCGAHRSSLTGVHRRAHTASSNAESFALVTEFCARGSLYDLLVSSDTHATSALTTCLTLTTYALAVPARRCARRRSCR
jgi:serine/threonine protein kinase